MTATYTPEHNPGRYLEPTLHFIYRCPTCRAQAKWHATPTGRARWKKETIRQHGYPGAVTTCTLQHEWETECGDLIWA